MRADNFIDVNIPRLDELKLKVNENHIYDQHKPQFLASAVKKHLVCNKKRTFKELANYIEF